MKSKYKTLAELKAAYESGELGREYILMLDNDGVTLTRNSEEACNAEFADLDPGQVLRQALDLMGIPWVES